VHNGDVISMVTVQLFVHVSGYMTNMIIFIVLDAYLLAETGVQCLLFNFLRYVYLDYSHFGVH
jgi:hypothetical protein